MIQVAIGWSAEDSKLLFGALGIVVVLLLVPRISRTIPESAPPPPSAHIPDKDCPYKCNGGKYLTFGPDEFHKYAGFSPRVETSYCPYHSARGRARQRRMH